MNNVYLLQPAEMRALITHPACKISTIRAAEFFPSRGHTEMSNDFTLHWTDNVWCWVFFFLCIHAICIYNSSHSNSGLLQVAWIWSNTLKVLIANNEISRFRLFNSKEA